MKERLDLQQTRSRRFAHDARLPWQFGRVYWCKVTPITLVRRPIRATRVKRNLAWLKSIVLGFFFFEFGVLGRLID